MADFRNSGPSFWGDQVRGADADLQGGAVVANGATVAVRNSAGANSKNATAVVTDDTLTGVNLPATTAMVDNAQTVAGVTGTGTTATITVANGVITGIALS